MRKATYLGSIRKKNAQKRWENTKHLKKIIVLKKEKAMKDDKFAEIKTIIFEAWNQAGIIKHRKLSQKAEVKIRSALKDYTLEEILTAIKNYGVIVNDNSYYFSYRWSLEDFLARGIQKFLDDACYDNFRTNKKKVYKEKDDVVKF